MMVSSAINFFMISGFVFFLMTCVPLFSAQDVRLPPSLIDGPIMVMHYSDRSRITLPCFATGFPEPVRTWWKNNEILDVNNDNIEQSPVDESLTIISAREADQGYYQCRITNAYGTAMTNVSFLQMAQMDQFHPTPGPQLQSVSVNGHVCLQCQQLHSIPDASYTWSYNTTQNGNQIAVTELNNIQINPINPYLGYLCLTNIQTGDIGSANNRTYRCNVYNGIMSTTYSGSYYRLTQAGTDGTYSSGLEFKSPSPLIGLEGQGIDLRCFFYGNPVPSVTWQKNDQTVGNRWSLINSNTGLRLTSGNLIQTDAGNYTCTGSNGVGSSSSSTIHLAIEAVPVFISEDDRPHDMNFTDGDTVTIFCNPHAIPDVTVNWFKDGVVLNSPLPPKYSLNVEDGVHYLTISNVCKACGESNSGDHASIQCNASNIHGYAFAQGYVNVLAPTVISSEGGARAWNPNTNEDFACEAESDDSTSVDVSWFYDGDQIIQSDTIFIDEFQTLHVLMENDEDGGQSRFGDYKCIASNGVSEDEIIYHLREINVNSASSLWWVGLLVGLLLLLLLLLLFLLFCCIRNNDKDSYPVDEKERKNGNNPEKELQDTGFQTYQLPSGVVPALYGSSYPQNNNYAVPFYDNNNMAPYARDDDEDAFDKDAKEGTFVGQYPPPLNMSPFQPFDNYPNNYPTTYTPNPYMSSEV